VIADRHLGKSILAAILATGIVYCSLPGIGMLIFGNYEAGATLLGGAFLFAWGVARLMRQMGSERVM
jgi:hypothetical protein